MSQRTKPGPAAPRAPVRFAWWRYAVVAAVLLAVAVFLFALHQGSPAQTTSSGGLSGERGLRVGAAAPSIPLQSTSGGTLSLDQMKGSKLVVYFYESSG